MGDSGRLAPVEVGETRGERIQRLRRRHGLSQTQLGTLCGVGRRAVYDWEQDAHTPTGAHLWALARALGVTEGYLELGDGGFDRLILSSFEILLSRARHLDAESGVVLKEFLAQLKRGGAK